MAATAPAQQVSPEDVQVGGGAGAAQGGENLSRAGTLAERAGTALQSAGSNLQLQRANTLPTDDKELLHAATMPMTFDIDAERPCCLGLWKVQQFFGFILGLAFLIGFSAAPTIDTYPDANSMLGLTLLIACFWIFEVMPVYITALMPMLFLPFMGIMSSENIAEAYWNWISMLVVAVYLVDIALEHVHLPRRISLLLLLEVGITHPAALLACFMGLCWILAMFLNSIAVALVVTPFAIGLMNAAEDRARTAAEAAADRAQQEGGDRARAAEAEGRREAEKVQKFADGLLIGIAYSASAGGIATITGAIPNYFLAAEKVVQGEVSWVRWFGFALPISIVVGILVFIALYVRYVRHLDFRGIPREVLEDEYRSFVHEHGPLSRDEVIVGVLQVLQVVLLIIRPYTFTSWFDSPHGYELVNDATIALIPALLLFIIPSQVRPGEALLTWPAVHEKFDFGLLLLIGGSIAINYGFTSSGLSMALGDAMADLTKSASPFVLNLVVVTCVTLASQVLSGISTASTMLPVLSGAAISGYINPLSLMLPATVAASFTFLLPTACPPNIVVLAKSQELSRPLRFRDFFTNGIAVTIVAILIGSALSLAMKSAVFEDGNMLPQWACDADKVKCVWVQYQGTVRGVDVQEQACIVNLKVDDGATCTLWDGTVLRTEDYLGY